MNWPMDEDIVKPGEETHSHLMEDCTCAADECHVMYCIWCEFATDGEDE